MTVFDLQPTLKGNLIELRPLHHEDWALLYQCASDPLIWEQHPQSTRYQSEIFRKFFDMAMESKGAFAIVELATGKIIGSSRFYDFKENEKNIKIGYTFLVRAHWGGQFNRELKFLMLSHAMKFVDFVLFEIGEKNTRSRTAIERIGAKYFGPATLDNNSHVVYKIDREQFRASFAGAKALEH